MSQALQTLKPDTKSLLTSAAAVQKISEVLPDWCRGQEQRFVQRAMLTFAGRPELHGIQPLEFLRCVTEAAELGLAIDGRLCHVVKYGGKYQMQPSYLGMIAVARRNGMILDIDADVVCEHDEYLCRKVDAVTAFCHQRPALGQPRGKVVGVYARLIFPGGRFAVEEMDIHELERIRNLAPAKNVWNSHTDEMRKKTVIRRALKRYQEDAGIAGLLERMDDIDNQAEAETPTVSSGLPTGRTRIAPPKSSPTRAVEVTAGDPDLIAEDIYNDLSQRVGACESEAELEAVSAAVTERTDDLGPLAVKELDKQIRAKAKQLQSAD